jgi:hypothetical protein
MKTIRSVWLLSAILGILLFSCRKAEITPPNDAPVASCYGGGGGDDEYGGGSVDTTGISFCSPQTVSLCTKTGVVIGDVTVQTGSDRNTYVRYSLLPDWYFVSCSLFAGDETAIPVNSYGVALTSNFPYQKIFTSAYQQYMFKINGLPALYTVAANAIALKVVSNRIVDGQIVWGDGCSGNRINVSNWATKFNYARLNCMVADICSKPLKTYFDSTVDGADIVWPATGTVTMSLTGNVTVNVAGYTYTEAEGRAIYNTMNTNNSPEARNGFIHIAALKLSATNYSLDADLLSAVTTIEGWLVTRGKLSPNNLPTCNNQAVKNAIVYLDRWIKMYTCPDRR